MAGAQGHFLYGTDIELYGVFRDMDGSPISDVSGVKLTIKRPDQTIQTYDLTVIDGYAGVDVYADQIGIWRARLECATPSRSAIEGRFMVVESSVLTP